VRFCAKLIFEDQLAPIFQLNLNLLMRARPW